MKYTEKIARSSELRFEYDLNRCGQPDARVMVRDVDGYAVAEIEGIKVELEHVPVLCKFLSLVYVSSHKLNKFLNLFKEVVQ